MPSFPWTKKGSQASAGTNSELYDAAVPRSAGQAYPPQYPTAPPSSSRQPPPPDSFVVGQTRPPAHHPSRSLQAADFTSTQAGPPYPVQYDDSVSRPAAHPSPNLDHRHQEPRRLFKKKFGLSSSRDNLLDSHEEQQPDSSRIRRTLSTSRRSDTRSPQRPYSNTPSGSLTPVSRRATLAAREAEASGSETEGLRDLADFFRSTAPTGDPRRPVSLIGTPTASQSQWSEQRPSALQPQPGFALAQPTPRNRRSSFDQVQQQQQQQQPHSDYASPVERAYEPYHSQPSDSSTQHPLSTLQQEQSELHHTLLRGLPADRAYRPTEVGAYPGPPLPPPPRDLVGGAVHGGAASELNAHLNTHSVPASEREASYTDDSPRSPILPDMPGGAATLQPPPRRGSVESSEPPTPAMQKHMAHPPQQGGQRSPNVQENVGGRRTPEPAMAAGEMTEQDVNSLMRDYKELREKYSKVKRYYFEKEDQVKTLQNALAHQKLSQSRTSLDDGEYMARLTRLDGLISQLAFGFRKDWRHIPQWLQPYVNKDAITVGKQEMTAVGRAFISNWLVEEVFDNYFHPGLDFEVSRELKAIQRNIRVFSPALQTGEEEEALTNKIINWRLSTMDGLQHLVNSPESTQRKQTLVQLLTGQLVANLLEHMNEPAPAGIEGGVHMIMELVVAILMHLPFESRDVQIEYFSPGQPVSGELMRVEQGIPALSSPMAELPDDPGSVRSHSSEMQRDDMQEESQQQAPQLREESSKKGLFGLMGGNKKATPAKGGSAAGTSQSSLLQPPGSSGGPKEERVRLCVFLGLQIRGKMVLQKAPVFKI